MDSLPAELQGKPKNIGMGRLSLLQWIFLTQESNWGLLHCRWILYQLSYQGSTMDISRSHQSWWIIWAKHWATFPSFVEPSFVLGMHACLILCSPMDCNPPASSVHGDSPGKNTEVGCHALLQGIFPTQGSKPVLLHCRWILYHLNHQKNPIYIHTHSGILPSHKKNEIMAFAATWMDLEIINIILSEVSRTEKNKYHDITYMWNL